MGISCDFEAGSMESEIKPTCNEEFIKLHGQHELHEMTVKTADIATAKNTNTNYNNSTEPKVSIIDDSKATDDVALLSSVPTLEVRSEI